MNLVVDIGNTLIKVAVVEGADVLLSQVFASADEVRVEALQEQFPALRQAIAKTKAQAVQFGLLRCFSVFLQCILLKNQTKLYFEVSTINLTP